MAKKAPDGAWLYFGLFILIVVMIASCSWYFNSLPIPPGAQ